MKRIVSLLAALMMCIAPTAYAEEAAEAAAVQDGQDQQTETENWRIELPSGITVASFEMLYSDVGTFETASAQIGLFSDERTLFKSSSGHTDIKHGTVPDDDSVYDWGSISKTFVWVSVMQLCEQGLIDLDRDIREYLPDGFFRHLRYDDPITMINLMDHDAGWQENSEPMFKDDPQELLSLGDELRAVEPIQTHRPGEVASYSNYGAALAGYIVELVSGQDYTEYVHEHILSPLGMEHTAIGAAHTDNTWALEQRRKTIAYRFSLGHPVDLGPCMDILTIYPAGSAIGTLDDLMTWGQALMTRDDALFQDPATWDEMFAPTDFYGESDIPVNAHGFWYEEHQVRVIGHNGAMPGGQAYLFFDPESKVGLAILVNTPDGDKVLSDAPASAFGDLKSDIYGAGAAKDESIHGWYTPSRDVYTGMLKSMPYMTAIHTKQIGDVERIEDTLYQFTAEDPYAQWYDVPPGRKAILFGRSFTDDGRALIELPSIDYVLDKHCFAKLMLLTLYMILGIAAIYYIRIVVKLAVNKRYVPYKGHIMVLAGEAAQIVSVIAFLSVYAVYLNYQGGLPARTAGVISAVQTVCMIVCGGAAVSSAVCLIRTRKRYHIAVMAANILFIAAMILFEMFIA